MPPILVASLPATVWSGDTLDALREAYFGVDANRLILIEYQALTRSTTETLRMLYEMLDEPNFAHELRERGIKGR